MSDCIDLAKKTAEDMGAKLSNAEAARIIKKVGNYANALLKSGKAKNHIEAAKMAVTDGIEEHLAMKAISKMAILADIRAGRIYDARAEAALAEGKLVGDALRSMPVGSTTNFKGGKVSYDTIQDVTFKKYVGFYETALLKDGVLEFMKKRENQKAIFMETWNLSLEKPRPGSVTGNEKALKVAKVRNAVHNATASDITAAGGYVKKTEGFGASQTHDRNQMVGIGKKDGKPVNFEDDFQVWKDFILPKLDDLKTFKGEDPIIWLREAFQNIYTGDYDSAYQSKDPLKQNAGMVGKLAADRKIFFKDAESAWEYNERFGEKDLHTGDLKHMQDAAKGVATLQLLGANPDKVYKNAYGRIAEKIKSDESITNKDKQIRSLQSWKTDAAINLASGKSDVQGDPRWAARQANLQGVVAMSMNGAITLSAIPGDLLTMGVWASRRGTGVLRVMGNTLKNFLGQQDPKMKEHLRRMAFGLEGAAGTAEVRLAQYDRSARWISGFNSWVSKATLLNRWTNASKEGAAQSITGHTLGSNSHLKLSSTPDQTQRMLHEYGIGSEEWDILRQGTFEHKGERFITVADLDSLPEASKTKLKEIYGKSWESSKLQLETKFLSMLHRETGVSTLTPGLKERIYTTFGGMQAGSPAGMTARNLMMYKGYPVAALSKMWADEVHGQGYRGFLMGDEGIAGSDTWIRNNKLRAAGIVAAGLASGYAAITVRDLLAGKEAQSFENEDGSFNINLLRNCFQRGGVAGLYGDLVLNQYERGFRDVSSQLAGPVWSKVVDPAGVTLSNAMQGKWDQAKQEAFSGAVGLVPNVIFARQALDRAVLWSLQEWKNPGYLERLERNIKNKTGQDYWLDTDQRLFK